MAKEKSLRIAFTGPSGSGKTTICKWLNQALGLEWSSTSAGDLIPQTKRKAWVEKYGYERNGHKNAIRLSHTHPEFANEFQQTLLEARSDQILQAKEAGLSLILDRSPLDNITYMLDQSSMHMSEPQIEAFIKKAQLTLMDLDLIFFIPCLGKVENNGSRIPNYYYQRKITGIFHQVIEDFWLPMGATNQRPPLTMLQNWDFDLRKNQVLAAVEALKNKIGKDEEYINNQVQNIRRHLQVSHSQVK